MSRQRQRFPGVAREMLHAAVLDAAESIGARSGWQTLRMADVADAVGISRQTLYAGFESKPALVRAVVVARTERLLAVLTEVLTTQTGIDDAVRAAVRFLLDTAKDDPLVKCLITGPDADFLALVTTGSGPIIDGASRVLTEHVLTRRPDADPTEVAIATDVFARLVLSHVLTNDRDIDGVADDIAAVLGPYLTAVLG